LNPVRHDTPRAPQRPDNAPPQPPQN